MTAPVLAAVAVIPVAAALEPADGTSRTTTATAQHAIPADRVQAHRASRDRVRPEPPAPSMADVVGLAVAVDQPPAAADLSPRWATADLNVWSQTDEDSRRLIVVPAGDKVQVTGIARGPWAQVARGDHLGWVHKAYLARSKPTAGVAVSAHISGAPCPDGSAVESGLRPHTIEVYRAVCAAFPAVTSWGGLSGSGGDHGAGMALDIMCTGSLGDAIAAYVRAHASELGVSYVIWSQHIWTVQRSSEGWRAMPDRGSTTANHYDHVHVSVY
ncbi:MAG: hypothetical protein QOD68_803 [Actinomycetota bacterium]|jgi:hypothetical protein|nr:hypothetical protein [Actinomycetota bacterium]